MISMIVLLVCQLYIYHSFSLHELLRCLCVTDAGHACPVVVYGYGYHRTYILYHTTHHIIVITYNILTYTYSSILGFAKVRCQSVCLPPVFQD